MKNAAIQMMDTDWEFSGAKVRILRQAEELTQADFASTLGVSRAQIIKLEADQTIPTTSILLKICNRFRVPPDYFFIKKNHQPDDKTG